MTGSEFRSILRQLRLPQVVLASELGVHETTVSRWASGKIAPIPGYVLAYLRLYEVAYPQDGRKPIP
jgi:DNA-binding transcriptional regulator YiaG